MPAAKDTRGIVWHHTVINQDGRTIIHRHAPIKTANPTHPSITSCAFSRVHETSNSSSAPLLIRLDGFSIPNLIPFFVSDTKFTRGAQARVLPRRHCGVTQDHCRYRLLFSRTAECASPKLQAEDLPLVNPERTAAGWRASTSLLTSCQPFD
jgi:hypothetical protein